MMANRNKKLMLGSNRQVRSSCKQWAGDWYILHLFNQKADWQTCCVLCLFCVMVQAIWGAKMSKLWKSHQVGILQHLGGYFCAAMSDFMFFCQTAVILGGLIAIGFALALQDHSATHLARTEKTWAAGPGNHKSWAHLNSLEVSGMQDAWKHHLVIVHFLVHSNADRNAESRAVYAYRPWRIGEVEQERGEISRLLLDIGCTRNHGNGAITFQSKYILC